MASPAVVALTPRPTPKRAPAAATTTAAAGGRPVCTPRRLTADELLRRTEAEDDDGGIELLSGAPPSAHTRLAPSPLPQTFARGTLPSSRAALGLSTAASREPLLPRLVSLQSLAGAGSSHSDPQAQSRGTDLDEFQSGAAFANAGPLAGIRGLAAAASPTALNSASGPQKRRHDPTQRGTVTAAVAAATPRAFVRLPSSVAAQPSTGVPPPPSTPQPTSRFRSSGGTSPLYTRGGGIMDTALSRDSSAGDLGRQPGPNLAQPDAPGGPQRPPVSRFSHPHTASASLHQQSTGMAHFAQKEKGKTTIAGHNSPGRVTLQHPCVHCGSRFTDTRFMPIVGRVVDDPGAERLGGLMHLGENVDRFLLPKHASSSSTCSTTTPSFHLPCPASVLAAWPSGGGGGVGLLHVAADSAVQLADASATAVLERTLIQAMLPRLPRRLATHAGNTVSYWCRTDGRVYEMLWCTQCQPLPVVVGARVIASSGPSKAAVGGGGGFGIGDVFLFVSGSGSGGGAKAAPLAHQTAPHGRRVGAKTHPEEHADTPVRPSDGRQPAQPRARPIVPTFPPRPPTPPQAPVAAAPVAAAAVVAQTPKRTIFRGRLNTST